MNCVLTVALYRMANTVIEDTQTGLHCAIDRVIQNVARTVSRKRKL